MNHARYLAGGALLVLALHIAASADAQTASRLRGTIASAGGDALSVKMPDGRTADVAINEKTRIVFAQPIALTEIRSGDFLGVTSVKRKDGTLAAYDVRRFPKPVNPGHRPYDGHDDQTMTNATVSATVHSTRGRELVLSYEGGWQKVIVPDGASITALVPGDRAQLVPGSYVSLLAAPEDGGRLVARSIEVRKVAPKPSR